jgi:hypothetical protein
MSKPGASFFILLSYVTHSNLVSNAHRQSGPEKMAVFKRTQAV